MENKTPQLEDGYTQIANEIVEALAECMPGFTEGQIIWYVLRKTYGWHKKEDKISISQIVKATKKSKRAVIYALQNLESKKMILIQRTTINGEKQSNNIQFNKLYSQWVVQNIAPQVLKNRNQARISSAKEYISKRVVQKNVKSSAKDGNLVVQNKTQNSNSFAHTKETIQKIYTKETITKDISEVLSAFANVNPSYKQFFPNKTQRACTKRLLEQYGKEKILNLIERLPEINAKPYAPTITSPWKLEVKMGDLLAYLQQEGAKINKFTTTKV